MTTQIIYRDPYGNPMTIINDFVGLEYARAENDAGYLILDLDPAQFSPSFFKEDARLEPWRTVGGLSPYLDGETIYFLRKWGYKINSDGREVLRLEAEDANYLLLGRIIAYASGDAMASMTNQADDMCKDIVRQNLGSAATDTARSWAAYLTIQADLTLGPSITKDFSRRYVLNVLQDIAAESLQQGTYLAFDTVYASPTMLEFRTYAGLRGNNHGQTSGSTVVISRERKNLEEPELIYDYTNVATYVYAGGMGTGADRIIKTASDTAAIGLSPFGRREKFIDARNTSETGVQSEANAGLSANPKKTLTGRIADTPDCLDGVHYRFGDIVYGEYRGEGFDAHINAMHVTIAQGEETRENYIKGEK